MKSKLIAFAFFAILGWLPVIAQSQEEGVPRWGQVSIIYPIGTNGLEAARYINKVSLSAVGGISHGVQGFEAAGLGNIVTNDVRGVQLAGFSNVVGGEVTGTQFAGFANVTRGSAIATQFAGAANIVVGSLKGTQFSGGFSYARKDLQGTQISGFANYAGDGVQGAQVSPFLNYSGGSVRGLQLSAFGNYAGSLSGVQIGIINYVNDFQKGATVGFINIVKNGMMKFEVFHDDIVSINGAFKSGTERLYGIVTAGIDPNRDYWIYGAGFGSQFDLPKQFLGNVETTFSQLRRTDRRVDEYFVQRLNLNLGYRLFGRFEVWAGPALNLMISRPEAGQEHAFGDIVPSDPLASRTDSDWQLHFWPGYRFAIRF